MEPAELVLSESSRSIAAVLLLAIVTIEVGGVYVLRLARGAAPATPFQQSFARAGHAHAGVLVTLALVVLIYADAAELSGAVAAIARQGVPLAALLIPGGFFFSSMGANRTVPSRAIALIWAGAAVLAAGVVATGIGLLGS